MPSWLDVCRSFVDERCSTSTTTATTTTTTTFSTAMLMRVLDAFACADPRSDAAAVSEREWGESFEALEQDVLGWLDPTALAALLAVEVDEQQAAMFARRVVAVVSRLGELGGVEGRLLRVGMLWRLRGVVEHQHQHQHQHAACGTSTALRVRALADFYYSQAGLLFHLRSCSRSGAASPSIERLVAQARWCPVAPGVEHLLLDGVCIDGPLHVNVVRMDPQRVRLKVVDCRTQPSSAAAAEEDRPLPFAAVCRAAGAICGVSGGFFLYSEPDITPPEHQFDPVGLLLSSSALLSPPFFRRAALITDAGGAVQLARVGIDQLVVKGEVLHCCGGCGGCGGCGDRSHRLELWTRARGRTGPPLRSFAVRSNLRVDAVGESLPVPLNGAVVVLPQELQELDVCVGDSVEIELPVLSSGGGVAVNGIAGGPMLLEEGKIAALDCAALRREDFWGSAPPLTFSQDETDDQNMLPRLAVGLDGEGWLLLAAVDGRNFDRALGMTLQGTARLMQLLGCHTAANLDGGSSKRMYIAAAAGGAAGGGGHVVDLPSTDVVSDGKGTESIRPVHTACLFISVEEER